jgi:hypothetical protein
MFDRQKYMEAYNKAYYHKDRLNQIERAKKYAEENPDKVKEKRKQWWKKNGKIYREQNIEKIRNAANKYNRKESTKEKARLKRQIDPNFKLQHLLRARVSHALRRKYSNKSLTTIQLIGCSIDECRMHLERQFRDGMTWNSANWHIDHIIPLSHFDLTNVEEQKKAFHYTNLQPLFAEENLKKSNRIMI